MSKTLDVVNQYFAAWKKDAWANPAEAKRRLRALVTDDYKFIGPLETWNGPDELLAAAEKYAPGHLDMRLHKIFEDGNDVCCIYDFTVNTPKGRMTMPMAEWLTIVGGKVAKSTLYFDTAPLMQK